MAQLLDKDNVAIPLPEKSLIFQIRIRHDRLGNIRPPVLSGALPQVFPSELWR